MLGASTDWTSATLADLQNQINSLKTQVFGVESPGWYDAGLPASGGYTNNIALTQRIDQLSGTKLSNVTVDGVSGLKTSEIPDLSGSYLSNSGGTLSGLLNFTNASSSQLSIFNNA